jgi:hypothetical protein
MSDAPSPTSRLPWRERVRFDRHELAGAFGDIGTDLPLIVGMIVAAGLDSASVFLVFGALQILSGLYYGLPMPMQPLKAMAVIVIAQQLSPGVLAGGGVAIGVMMLLLAWSGALEGLVRAIPRCVVRGIQLGLGLKLAALALGDYVPRGGSWGWAVGAAGFAVLLLLRGNRRVPPGLVLIGAGALWALAVDVDHELLVEGMGIALPSFQPPTWGEIVTGFLVLAIPQLPLSLSNSVIATRQTVADLFPARVFSVRRIGTTYGVANLVAPMLGGVPVCHGCGGLAGHFAFGARTGGSVIIYGALFAMLGLLFSGSLDEAIKVFPMPVLGVVLLFESLTLMLFVEDTAREGREPLGIALLVGAIACWVPQGFVVGMIVGTLLDVLRRRKAPG